MNEDIMMPLLLFTPMILIVIAVIVFIVRMMKKSAAHTVDMTGIILETKDYDNISLNLRAKVRYTYQGVTYEEYSGNGALPLQNNHYLEVGSEVKIRVNPKNPSDFYLKDVPRTIGEQIALSGDE